MDGFHLERIAELKNLYREIFGRLSIDEERTLEFCYSVGESRGVDVHLYVAEAIKRAGIKERLEKPIKYVASLCKSFYQRGLHAQPSQEEQDILTYIQSKIGNISDDNKNLIRACISTNGAVRAMAATSEVLNNSKLQDQIIEAIITRVAKLIQSEFHSESRGYINEYH